METEYRFTCNIMIIEYLFHSTSASPNGEQGHYIISVTIDGKTFAELDGTVCVGCYFDVSYACCYGYACVIVRIQLITI